MHFRITSFRLKIGGLLFCSFLGYILYCNSESHLVEPAWWKYKDGDHFEDVLVLKKDHLNSLNIYKDDQFVFCFGNTLYVKRLETGEFTSYSRK